MKNFLSIFLFIMTIKVFGQGEIRQVVQFEIGQSSISPFNEKIIDSVISKINDKRYEISLIGHTCTTGSDEFNMKLSRERSISVSNYLGSKGINKSLIETKYSGEKNPIFRNTPENERIKNRCVEIIVRITNSEPPKKSIIQTVTERPRFENDTIIRFKNGTQIEIPSEAFYPRKIKDIKFVGTEIFSICDMLINNTVTRSINGDCLTSAGMLNVRAEFEGAEIQPNKGYLIKIKIPTLGGNPDKSMKLYGGVKNKDGELIWKDMEPEVTYEEGKDLFYVFKVDSFLPINLDKPIGIACIKNGHKIKVTKLLEDIKICQTYPDENYLAVAEKLSERKFKLDKVDKEKKPIITVFGVNHYNPFIAQVSLDVLKYRKWTDTYIINKKHFIRELRDYNGGTTARDYLCKYLNN